jgi:acyl-CoA reductase-like NAD-dependent aldehyde dehydrogenase
MMTILSAQDAISAVDPQKWADTPVSDRIVLLKQVLSNIDKHKYRLAEANAGVRNERTEHKAVSISFGRILSYMIVAKNVQATIEQYEHLEKTGELIKPLAINKVADGLWDIHVYPRTFKEKLLAGGRQDYIRVTSKEEPTQINPLTRKPGICAILGAGNTAGSAEIIKALFWSNLAVVHKAHPIHEEIEAIWSEVLQPLVDHKALSFCDANQGQGLSEDSRIGHLYFTGGASTANAIAKSTKANFIAECGGVNPTIVVPGIREWTKAEMEHHAIQIASSVKVNGGAVCARNQIIVTCQKWSQREEFCDILQRALREETWAWPSYYPGWQDSMEKFKKQYQNATIIEPEEGKLGKEAEVLFIRGDKAGSFACKSEAFTQVVSEVPLDVEPDCFLPKAVKFCNDELWGSLCATIVVSNETVKAEKNIVDKAITDLKYGSVALNWNAASCYFEPQLIWGGYDQSKVIESGNGNFGNIYQFEPVVKSIVYDSFISPGHVKFVNKQVVNSVVDGLCAIALNPSWYNHISFLGSAIYGSFKKRDF